MKIGRRTRRFNPIATNHRVRNHQKQNEHHSSGRYQKPLRYRSTTHYVLSSLIPYTEANLQLAFRPTAFFNTLEKLDRYHAKASTIAGSYYKAIENDLIEVTDNVPRLTKAGIAKLNRYEPRLLGGSAKILVIFDIPETARKSRYKLRILLRELQFERVQQSVWQTEYDILNYLLPEIKDLKLQHYVQIYESARVA